ncbi:hypothetical protein SD311_005340 [Staphylococcus sp. KG4-3]|uniref:hypothetical protein n=1 Tax=Staphylococcus sp. KG4-3 TaxID=3093634 RepID=UPI00298F2A80|nr:hypothetical protein [Staphylococcus sp. KG4-1]
MMINKERMLFFINGVEVSAKDVEKWEFKRLKRTQKYLRKKFDLEKDINNVSSDLNNLSEKVVNTKLNLGFDKIRETMKCRYKLGNLMSLMAEKLSFGNRKFCITEIYVPNSDLNSTEIMNAISEVMMEHNDKNDLMNIVSNPDHYVLLGRTDNLQEVLEITGGSPLPTRFFAEYYNETKLKSKKSSDYDVELPGVAKLENGVIIGGMRHQVKRENDGFRFKALVEFPGILPNSMIKQHQLHLACEFGHWISFVLDEK